MHKFMRLGALLLLMLVVPQSRAHTTKSEICNDRFAGKNPLEFLLEQASQLEESVRDLEKKARGRALSQTQFLHADLDVYIEELFDHAPEPEQLADMLSALVARYQAIVYSLSPPPSAMREKTVRDLMEAPAEVRAAVPIPLGNDQTYVMSVEFNEETLVDFWNLQPTMQTKFLRAIFVGVVGPVGESGIKLVTSVHRHLIEVKAYSGARFLGCLEAGRLRLLKYIPDHPHSGLGKYYYLCN